MRKKKILAAFFALLRKNLATRCRKVKEDVLGNRAESQDLIDLGKPYSQKRRQEIHLSQEVLAEKTGISPNTISRD